MTAAIAPAASTISFIVPTIGRASLRYTLDSIIHYPGDEIIVCGDAPMHPAFDWRSIFIRTPRGNDWGCKERTIAIAAARCDYLAFIDDDDTYTLGARELMAAAIIEHPDRPILFRIRYPNGRTLWADPEVRCGNVSSQMILIPNDPPRLGRWSPRREGDYDFLASSLWPHSDFVFKRDVIALMGHDD